MTDSNDTDASRVTRRRTLKGIGAGVSLAALGGASVGSAAATPESSSNTPTEEWPQFQYDATNDGHGPPGGPRKDATVKWKDKPTDHEGLFQAGPVVKDGIVYCSNWSHSVFAWDEETGERIWTYSDHGNLDQSAAVYNDTVYFVSVGGLYALNANTGNLRWSSSGKGGFEATGVTVANDTLYYGTIDGFKGKLFAVDPETGEYLWNYTTDWYDFIFHTPAVKDGRVYFEDSDRTQYAIDADTGEEIWVQGYGGARSEVTAWKGYVFTAGGKGIHRYDAETGEVRNLGDRQFFTTVDEGEEGQRKHRVRTSVAVSDDILYFGSNSEFFAIDPETAEELWRKSENFPGVAAAPAVTRGIVYVGDRDGVVHGFNAGTGEELFSIKITGAQIASAPAVANGMIFVGTEAPGENENTMFALEDPTR